VSVNWNDLLAALAIVCVIEGVMPFVNPDGMRRLFLKLSALGERELRFGGLASVIVGFVVLYLVRS
jgi:uncharacterized protein YjeT (DUF2065 family)